MKQNSFETIVGFIVIGVAIIFGTYAYQVSGSGHHSDGYIINATFQNSEGIVKGSDVMIAGITIGKVEDLILNPDSFLADTKLRVNKDLKIPKDSSASIVSSGLLGGKYIVISPGGDDENLANEEKIKYTNSAINFESLLNKFMVGKADSNSSD